MEIRQEDSWNPAHSPLTALLHREGRTRSASAKGQDSWRRPGTPGATPRVLPEEPHSRDSFLQRQTVTCTELSARDTPWRLRAQGPSWAAHGGSPTQHVPALRLPGGEQAGSSDHTAHSPCTGRPLITEVWGEASRPNFQVPAQGRPCRQCFLRVMLSGLLC